MRRPNRFFTSRAHFAYHWLAIVLLLQLFIVPTALGAPSQDETPAATVIPDGAEYRQGEVIVKFKDTSVGQFQNLAVAYLSGNTDIAYYKNLGLTNVIGLASLPRISVLSAPGADVKTLVTAFSLNPAVEYAEPNYIRHISREPADSFYTQGRQDYLKRINLPDAWEQVYGSATNAYTPRQGVVIAVVDTGIRNNRSLTLDSGEWDLYSSFVPNGDTTTSSTTPLRSPNGPAAPLPKGIVESDPCYLPQPSPYPSSGQGQDQQNAGCTVLGLYGGDGVWDLRGRVYYAQGISTVPDCGSPRWKPNTPECTTDYNGHGTAVAGIIAANPNNDYSEVDDVPIVTDPTTTPPKVTIVKMRVYKRNYSYGMVGVNWNYPASANINFPGDETKTGTSSTGLLSVRACNWNGECADSWLAEGITQAADAGARIINLSLGGPNYSKAMAESIKYAQSKGAIIVAASGNAANGVAEYPAAYDGVIAVAATDENNNAAKFSSFGSWVSVAAPGTNILTTNINWPGTAFNKGNPYLTDDAFGHNRDSGDYTVVNGTSFSAPIVAGVISLMLEVNPNLSAEQVKSILQGTATDIDAPGRDDRTGYGLVNAGAAVRAAINNNLTPNRNSFVYGFVAGANPADVVMSLDPGQQVKNTDSAGRYRFDNLGAGVYTLRAILPKAARILGPVTITVDGSSNAAVPVNFDFASGQVIAGPGAVGPNSTQPPTGQGTVAPPDQLASQSIYFNKVAPVSSSNELSYFSETGHTLKGEFKRFWDSRGGLEVFGYPLSEEFLEVSKTDGKLYTVQYFQRNRFELHPENAGTAYVVLLGLLGSESVKNRNFPPIAPVSSAGNLIYFDKTGHTLSGRFLEYWNKSGGLDIFGYPVSEPLLENGLQVQYFERNRFEYHPENAGSKYDVLLGLLGVDLARNRNYIR
ncbi:MAG: S8 family serine peptidase [Chloroflexi bacterium]|uniref:S8 family serine peptidase n=1 Tax=Candidatus Chlorohelix allophototropha TaxID=3003348 RepID=A0A8T7LX96_9CHLR|nr:S8 family serine peptidase [Chloroflexota bacterium]WJW66705.1 S8 family serine peptidase [Chloroflexota bacterium L227-S17]